MTRPGFGPRRNCSPSRSSIRHSSLRATEYDYCNTNYALLGLIAEKVEGAAVGQNLSESFVRAAWHEEHLAPCQHVEHHPRTYAHGYLYGSSSYALADAPYPADLQAAAKAGTLKPNDDTGQNPSYALAAGGVISTADDLATWMRALVGGKVLDADYQRQWLDSPEPEDPSRPLRPEIWVWYRSDHLWAEQDVFSRRRDARLQLVHGLRSGQRCNADRLDQPDRVT